jgi:PAS domain S-box-containing protein
MNAGITVHNRCSEEPVDFMRVVMQHGKQSRPFLPADALIRPDGESLAESDKASALAQAIVDTVRDPQLVLDQNLHVVTANRAFYCTFKISRRDIQGCPVYELDNGRWDIPELRLMLSEVAPQHVVMEGYEVERDFPGIGRRSMLLNAREVFKGGDDRKLILLTIEDVTDRRAAEQQIAELLQQKEVILQEMQHRIANSLQIIASILRLKSRSVQSVETRLHLQDACDRVMSVAAVQQQLQGARHGEPITIGPYLSRLCETLAVSMIGDSRPISVKVEADAGAVASSEAVSMGLVTTELVINALKHAFPNGTAGEILISYAVDEANWRLSVSDNGAGLHRDGSGHVHTGLGSSIVKALADQLKASVETTTHSPGVTVSLIHRGE